MTKVRPNGTNADEWYLFLTANVGELGYVAVQIVRAIGDERDRCARLYESVNPASDDERINGVRGAGAMGAVTQYRDLIRGQKT